MLFRLHLPLPVGGAGSGGGRDGGQPSQGVCKWMCLLPWAGGEGCWFATCLPLRLPFSVLVLARDPSGILATGNRSLASHTGWGSSLVPLPPPDRLGAGGGTGS